MAEGKGIHRFPEIYAGWKFCGYGRCPRCPVLDHFFLGIGKDRVLHHGDTGPVCARGTDSEICGRRIPAGREPALLGLSGMRGAFPEKPSVVHGIFGGHLYLRVCVRSGCCFPVFRGKMGDSGAICAMDASDDIHDADSVAAQQYVYYCAPTERLSGDPGNDASFQHHWAGRVRMAGEGNRDGASRMGRRVHGGLWTKHLWGMADCKRCKHIK